MKTVIHVNQHKIRANNKAIRLWDGEGDLHDNLVPVLTTKTSKTNTYSDRVSIVDGNGNVVARVIHSPTKPLSCGARVWIEADSKNVEIEHG